MWVALREKCPNTEFFEHFLRSVSPLQFLINSCFLV